MGNMNKCNSDVLKNELKEIQLFFTNGCRDELWRIETLQAMQASWRAVGRRREQGQDAQVRETHGRRDIRKVKVRTSTSTARTWTTTHETISQTVTLRRLSSARKSGANGKAAGEHHGDQSLDDMVEYLIERKQCVRGEMRVSAVAPPQRVAALSQGARGGQGQGTADA